MVRASVCVGAREGESDPHPSLVPPPFSKLHVLCRLETLGEAGSAAYVCCLICVCVLVANR